MSQAMVQQAIEHYRSGRPTQAQSLCRQILANEPSNAVELNMLGLLAHQAGYDAIAGDLLRRAIAVAPDLAEAHGNLGLVLMHQGRLREAIDCFARVIALQPNLAVAHHNLGNCLLAMRQFDEAIASYQRVLVLQPNLPQTHNSLGSALQGKHQLDEAAESFRTALKLQPAYAHASNNLAVVLCKMGRLDEAIECFRRALASNPGYAEAHSNWIYALHFHPDYDASALFAEHRRWSQRHADPLRRYIQPHGNDRSSDRRLRIGYVSPDFREHVVGWNILPLLREHDHRQFEIFCYSKVGRPDAFTDQIRACADAWRSIVDLSDEQTAQLIRSDQIDILVDLTLHMRGSKLLMFARKPAPVQVTYLGYCSTSGMEAMDYRLSDPYMDPPGSDLTCYSERTIRLPQTYWCYQPGGQTPDVSPLPALNAGRITFGCMNNFAKISTVALELWTKLLDEARGSRLLLHLSAGSHRQAVAERFVRQGVSADRLEFVGFQSWEKYIRQYDRIDIAMDPFPYNGGITTCDALWMGAPVVTLRGRTSVGRAGVSILSNVGLPELIAADAEQYLRVAVDLANDLPRLAKLRAGLRERMRGSPLMDAPRFARNVESAYRQMWRDWCENHAKS